MTETYAKSNSGVSCRRTAHLLLGSFLGLVAVPFGLFGPAAAQSQAESDRANRQADFRPAGIELGSFRLFPTLGGGISYDSNVFRTDAAQVSDWFASILPGLVLQSTWGRHELRLSTSADIRQYFSETSESRTNWRAGASGRLDVSRPLRIFFDAGVEQLHEQRGSPDLPGSAAGPTPYMQVPLGVRTDYQVGRLNIRSGFSYTLVSWEPTERIGLAPFDNADRDRSDFRATGQVKYDFSPGYGAFVYGEYLERSYDEAFDRNGFDRDASGYRAGLGLSFEVTDLIIGQVAAGYASYDFVDAAFADISSFDLAASLTWYPTQLSTVRIEARRTLEPSTLVGVGGVLTTVGTLSLEHELLRNLMLSASYSLVNEEFEGTARTDNSQVFAFKADYLANRYLTLTFKAGWTGRDSTSATQDYGGYDAGLVVTAKF